MRWILILSVVVMSCDEQIKTDLADNAVIPKPVQVVASGGQFELSDNMTIAYSAQSGDLQKSATYLQSILNRATGYDVKTKVVNEKPNKGIYLMAGQKDDQFGQEGYRLDIGESMVELSANTPEGVFRGVQTLRQVLPAEIERDAVTQGPWTIATGQIIDFPRYEFRSAMLDVSRHFFSVEDVKWYIDRLAALKINHLHLHLSDDQGWRIEIKSWPKLTTVGGSTKVGGGAGGYYTQEDYREIVQYASDRYITIIPEVDMPGHTFAALVSYPELNCGNKYPTKIESTGEEIGPKPYTGVAVGFSTLCMDKEIVYQFVDDVVRELAAMTPGPYLHLGGDESHVTDKEDYIRFFDRVQPMVAKYGKTMIGWEEIGHVQLDEAVVVQYWNTNEKTIELGATQQNKIIVSPAARAYLDMKYDSASRIGNDWAALIEVDAGYKWDPTTIHLSISESQILGIEAPLWTEFVENRDDLSYLAFPRIMGYAEIGWSAQEHRDWNGYKIRLGRHAQRLKYQGIQYYPSPSVPWD